MRTITANEMARAEGIDPKRFRAALRIKQFPWHEHYDRWIVPVGDERHREMVGVLNELIRAH